MVIGIFPATKGFRFAGLLRLCLENSLDLDKIDLKLQTGHPGMISMKTGCSQDGIRFGPFYKEDDHRSAGG